MRKKQRSEPRAPRNFRPVRSSPAAAALASLRNGGEGVVALILVDRHIGFDRARVGPQEAVEFLGLDEFAVHHGFFVGLDDRRKARGRDIVQNPVLERRDTEIGIGAVVAGIGAFPAGDEAAFGLDFDGARPERGADERRADATFGYLGLPLFEAVHHDIAVDEIEVIAREPLAERIQDAARAQNLGLETGPAAVRGRPHVDLLVQVVAVDRDFLDAQRLERGDDARNHRLAPDRHHRLGHGAGEGPQARTEPGGQDYGFLDHRYWIC